MRILIEWSWAQVVAIDDATKDMEPVCLDLEFLLDATDVYINGGESMCESQSTILNW